jgi:hypothetical protein
VCNSWRVGRFFAGGRGIRGRDCRRRGLRRAGLLLLAWMGAVGFGVSALFLSPSGVRD